MMSSMNTILHGHTVVNVAAFFFVYLFKDTLTMLFCPVDLRFTLEILFMFGKTGYLFCKAETCLPLL